MTDVHDPHYGETGAAYGAVCDSEGVPDNNQTKNNKPMADIKLSLSRSNPAQVIEIAAKLAGLLAPAAPATPPIPNMDGTVADLNTKLTAATTANNAYEAAKAQIASLRTTRDNAADDLRNEVNLAGNAAMKESKGDAASLQAAGFEIAGATPSPPPVLTPPQNLALTAGDHDATLDASCDPPGAKHIVRSYQWQYTTGDPVTGTYADVQPTSASNTTLTGLTSGQRIWVRVRVVTTHGTTDWSDPAAKIVP